MKICDCLNCTQLKGHPGNYIELVRAQFQQHPAYCDSRGGASQPIVGASFSDVSSNTALCTENLAGNIQ